MMYALVFFLGAIVGALGLFAILQINARRLMATAARLRDFGHRLRDEERRLATERQEHEAAVNRDRAELALEEREFNDRRISYDDLAGENKTLKRDLRNVDVNVRKLQMDRAAQAEHQDEIDRLVNEMGSRYLDENVKWSAKSLTENNFVQAKSRLLKAIERCRAIGLAITDAEEQRHIEDLKAEYEKVVRHAFAREEQARIKARQREELRLQKEVDAELERLELQRKAVAEALRIALAEAEDEHSQEIQDLKARLAEAEAKSERAKSQAQLTKAGHVYVISNIGAFGEGVYKVGLTRRLEPDERIRELSGAAVPFPFDVHMMISSEDAPALEHELHRALHRSRVNRVNPRKEFFRVDLEEIRKLVEAKQGTIEFIADAEALQYRQSVDMSDEDADYLEHVYESVVGDEDDDLPE